MDFAARWICWIYVLCQFESRAKPRGNVGFLLDSRPLNIRSHVEDYQKHPLTRSVISTCSTEMSSTHPSAKYFASAIAAMTASKSSGR